MPTGEMQCQSLSFLVSPISYTPSGNCCTSGTEPVVRGGARGREGRSEVGRPPLQTALTPSHATGLTSEEKSGEGKSMGTHGSLP